MKKALLSLLFSIFIMGAISAPFKFLPHKVVQPDGTIIECYVSGDEFFNWIHDKDGYSIIKGSDGYYYYATKAKGKIIASAYRVNEVNPNTVSLKKWVKISKEEYELKRERFNIPYKNGVSKAPQTGELNNLVIYIRFSGENEITTTRKEYDDKLNPETGYSLKSYFKEVSYNQLTINSTHYPDCDNPTTTNASYEDSHPRGYFQKYDATTNPDGYSTDAESTEREHQLLVDAVTWVNENYPIDESINIDGDNDGNVDNVCFMIQGNKDGWSDLLWAHRWALYTKTVYINGKRVYDYTFQPEDQVGVRTLCHEMFHALGAPDLYHYYNGTDLSPASYWDIMESGYGHMGAYMKYKYADQNWISEIPEITAEGTYTLNPLTSATNNCYKIASPYSTSEYFVVEYRKKSGDFESYLPGDGLLVYRINSDFHGNAQYDGSSVFDEVYLYRPGGTVATNGSPNSAYFSSDVNRTEINDDTNPSSFLSDGSDGGLQILNVTSAGSTISFDVKLGNVGPPSNFIAEAISPVEILLSWNLNSNNDNVVLAYSESGMFGTPVDGNTYSVGTTIEGGGEVLYTGTNLNFNHQALSSGQLYSYKLWSINSENEYSQSASSYTYTSCEEMLLPFNEDFSDGTIPSCWQNNDNDGTGQVWEFNNPASRDFNSTTGANGFAILDSDYYGSGASQDASLISPLLDLSIYETINLTFEHYYLDYQSELAELSYTKDGGQTWTEIQSWNATEGSSATPAIFNMDISNLVAGESEVKFKWKYVGSYGYYWIIDDIEITGTSNGNPVAITNDANGIDLETATLNGVINANENSITEIKFEYGTETGNYTNSINATPSSASGITNTPISAEISGLTTNTQYFYRIICKNGSEEVTGEEKSFTTEAKPTVEITSDESSFINTSPVSLLFSFSEEIKNLFDTDITVTNGTVTSIAHIENNDFNVEITPSTEGEITVQLEENAIEDLNNYGNIASDVFSIYFDETAPTVVISSSESTSTSANPIPIGFTFSEDILDFEITDISIDNGTASNFVSSTASVYTVDITPNNNGNVSVQLAANSYTDMASNNNSASETWTISYSAPTGIEKLNEAGIKLYPNPSNGLLSVEFNRAFLKASIKVMDYSGRLIYNEEINSSSHLINLTEHAKGSYVIQFSIDNKVLSTTLIIQ